MVKNYKRNHYVPQWYQKRFFISDQVDRKFYYLDLYPDTFVDGKGRKKFRNNLLRWGTPRCFYRDDLYTTRYGDWKSTEIEEKLFGIIDQKGRRSVEYFSRFQHPSANEDSFNWLLLYMSAQRLRTPKGLEWLAGRTEAPDKNTLLSNMQVVQNMHCAIWSECVWQLADATQSNTKFILSDNPVTVYNSQCFPGSGYCIGAEDPDIRLQGTHTIFPLSFDRILILTNLSWVRNRYQSPTNVRPNPNLFRGAIFNFTAIQTHRLLSEIEVCEINFILKKRAFRYLASAREEWLFPEDHIPSRHWSKLGDGLLLMPDPRSMYFGGEVTFGFKHGPSASFDEYGRTPEQRDFKDRDLADREWNSFHHFQGEFARRFGPERRGRSFEMLRMDPEKDDSEDHQHNLELERKHRAQRPRTERRRRRGR